MNKHESNQNIIFVYNAKSGIANALLDYGKKYIQPDKYDCQLCMVTYGVFGMKKDWKDFVKSLPYPTRFLHKDEFLKQYDNTDITFPTVLLSENRQLRVLISAKDFADIKTLESLKQAVKQKIALQ